MFNPWTLSTPTVMDDTFGPAHFEAVGGPASVGGFGSYYYMCFPFTLYQDTFLTRICHGMLGIRCQTSFDWISACC